MLPEPSFVNEKLSRTSSFSISPGSGFHPSNLFSSKNKKENTFLLDVFQIRYKQTKNEKKRHEAYIHRNQLLQCKREYLRKKEYTSLKLKF